MDRRPYRKTNKCKEARRYAAMLEIPERAYDDFQVKLEKAAVNSHETIMLTLPIRGGAFPGLRE